VPRDRVVIGPSFDGGYYLIGVRRAHAELFSKIDWSTEQTRRRALGLGLEVLDLDAWYDVDDAHSLQRLVYELTPKQTINATPADQEQTWAKLVAPKQRVFLRGPCGCNIVGESGVALSKDHGVIRQFRRIDPIRSSQVHFARASS
jgi:hypothetical protein